PAGTRGRTDTPETLLATADCRSSEKESRAHPKSADFAFMDAAGFAMRSGCSCRDCDYLLEICCRPPQFRYVEQNGNRPELRRSGNCGRCRLLCPNLHVQIG